VRDKVLLFGLSCATNCATHDPQLLTTTTFWHTQAARPFQHPAHEFQNLFERFLRMDAARSFDNIFLFRPSTSVATARARAVVRSAGLHELWRSRADRWSALDRPCAAQ
jgi:hypothetical protein